jgi:3',5'-cyclic AMP phosphodiesterase CpdA
MADLWSLIEDFEILNPEFVLLTGDVVNEGELEDYMGLRCYSRAKNIISEFSVPVYVGGGNHDLGGWDDTPPPDGTARRDWWRFFGWKHLDQTSGPGPFTQD